MISDIHDHPESMTRATHIAFYKNFIVEGYGDQMFTEHAGPGDFIDPAIAEKDLAELQEVSRSVSQLASRTIAHKSTRAVPKLTFNDIDACIEAIKKIAQKYILLLSATHNVLEPVMDDWQTIFTMKWIK